MSPRDYVVTIHQFYVLNLRHALQVADWQAGGNGDITVTVRDGDKVVSSLTYIL